MVDSCERCTNAHAVPSRWLLSLQLSCRASTIRGRLRASHSHSSRVAADALRRLYSSREVHERTMQGTACRSAVSLRCHVRGGALFCARWWRRPSFQPGSLARRCILGSHCALESRLGFNMGTAAPPRTAPEPPRLCAHLQGLPDQRCRYRRLPRLDQLLQGGLGVSGALEQAVPTRPGREQPRPAFPQPADLL